VSRNPIVAIPNPPYRFQRGDGVAIGRTMAAKPLDRLGVLSCERTAGTDGGFYQAFMYHFYIGSCSITRTYY
jgi:hypothetical protein